MAHASRPAVEQDKYILRLPDGMRDRLKAQAHENGRSMNAEIVALLSQALSDDYLPLSALGVMALLKRFDNGVVMLEDLMVSHFRPALDAFLADQAAKGNEMSRTEAVAFIVDEYLAGRGYAGRAAGSDEHNAADASKPKRS